MSPTVEQHIQDMVDTFAAFRLYHMKLNLEKCTFGVDTDKLNPEKCTFEI